MASEPDDADPCAKLQVTITAVKSLVGSSDILEVDVSVFNEASEAVTLLTWDSPLDPKAGALGVFQARDIEDGTLVLADRVHFARLLPPRKDSLMEIESGREASQRVPLPLLALASGRTYEIEATGHWKGVWSKESAEITAKMLENLGGARTGSFKSNVAVVQKT